MWSESHCHLGDIRIEELDKAREDGFEILLTSGIDLISSELAIKKASEHEIVKACIGIHPWYADEFTEDIRCIFKNLAANPEVVAVSEIGIDYTGRMNKQWVREEKYIDREVQIKSIMGQISLAEELNLPIIVHDRAPDQEILDLIEKSNVLRYGVAVHGFNKDERYVERCSKLGIYLSVGFRSIQNISSEHEQALKNIPMNLLLTETDSNQPYGVINVCEAVGNLKGTSREEIGQKSTDNLKRLIKL